MRKIMLGSLVALAACGTSETTEETATTVPIDSTVVFIDSAMVVDTTAVDTIKN